MPKKRRTKKSSKKKISLLDIKVLFSILMVLFITLLSLLYLLYDKGIIVFDKKPVKQMEKSINKTQKKLINDVKELLEEEKKNIEKKLTKLEEEPKKNHTKTVYISKKMDSEKEEKTKIEEKPKIEEKKTFPAIDDAISKKNKASKSSQKSVKKTTKPKNKKSKKPALEDKKPKLAIIVDDVAFQHQIQKIKQIPYKVTPSFMPRASNHPKTPSYTKGFKVYMLHLPLEALNHNHAEKLTLKSNWSYKRLKKEIKSIKADFPKAAYYNNHTGSKFTADLGAMKRLFKILKEENIKFLDSKTTPKSKGNIVAKEYGMHILSRDIFLDNSTNEKYIKNQLRKAVKIAKKRGYAIVIGHPYDSTLRVLKNAKPMLSGLELVYINEL